MFVLSARRSWTRFFSDDQRLPELAQARLIAAARDRTTAGRAGYTASGSPSNISIGRTVLAP